jgi:NADH:ubiquinone oxidoreductase subunit 2 (subunit N)
MKLLCILLSCISGLMLLAAAFVYLVDSKEGQQLLQRFLQQLRVLFFILLAVYVVSGLASAADSVSVFVSFLTLSVVAYFVREYRRPQREKRPGLGGAERTPVVPIVTRRSSGDDAEGGR